MTIRRLVFAITFAAVVITGLISLTTVPGVAAGGPTVQGTDVQPGAAGDSSAGVAQCIPCSPRKPCLNPLTVCSYSNPNHGCCLGYAGQN